MNENYPIVEEVVIYPKFVKFGCKFLVKFQHLQRVCIYLGDFVFQEFEFPPNLKVENLDIVNKNANIFMQLPLGIACLKINVFWDFGTPAEYLKLLLRGQRDLRRLWVTLEFK